MIGSLVHRVVGVCRLPPILALRQSLSQWLRRCRGVSASSFYMRGCVERYILGRFYMNLYALAPPDRPMVGEGLQVQVILALHLPLLVLRTRGVRDPLDDSDLGRLFGLLSAIRGWE